MVSEMIDYIAAALGIVLVFIAGVFFFTSAVTNGLAFSNQQNAAQQAENLLDYVLLTPGSPANWGQASSAPLALGLASPTSQTEYSLSQYSLMRLLVPNASATLNFKGVNYESVYLGGYDYISAPSSYFLNYSYAKTLLNITRAYEFRLTVRAALNVSISELSTSKYSVSVVSSSGSPVVGANVMASLVYGISGKGSNPVPHVGISTATGTTGPQGTATLSFSVSPSGVGEYYVVAQVESGGLTGEGYHYFNSASQPLTYILYNAGAPNQVTVVQHCAISTSPSCATDYINVSIADLSDGANTQTQLTCNVTKINPGKGGGDSGDNSTCKGTILGGFIVVTSQRSGKGPNSYPAVQLFPIDFAVGLATQFGGNPTGSPDAVTTSRVVLVAGISYVVSLVYWPDVGPEYGG